MALNCAAIGPVREESAPHIGTVQTEISPPPLRRREPVFNGFPIIVLILSAVIIGISALDFMSSEATRDAMWYAGAILYDPNVTYVARPAGAIGPLFLHTFLHVNVFHLVMNMTAMIAFGPAIAMAFGRGVKGAAAFLGFFFLCAAGGALAQLGWSAMIGEQIAAVGASTALSGFFAAAGWIQGGLRGAIRLSLPWLVINLVIAVAGSAMTGALFGMKLAWAAHLGGLAAGFVLFPLILKLVRPGVRLLD